MNEPHKIEVILNTDETGKVTGVDIKTNIEHDDLVMYWLVKATDKVMDGMYQKFKSKAN